MKKSSRMLRLPGGGALEVPMPNDSVYVKTDPVLSAPSDSASSMLAPILIGSALGGGLTWLFLRLSR